MIVITNTSKVFQFTLPQGEWPIPLRLSPRLYPYFNPHSRKGSDKQLAWCKPQFKHFNPHSRKGSDSIHFYFIYVRQYFNPHSRKGSDFDGSFLPDHPSLFQSTLPQGEWPWFHIQDCRSIVISIHTPARGVTLSFHIWPVPLNISIHTPARGVTHWLRYLLLSVFISIHTPARGVTCPLLSVVVSTVFQSTLPQGEWQWSTL